MNRTSRRPSASLAVALVALFCALGGTAVAQSGILITSPDQLASNVVTAPKIAADAISTSKVLNRGILQRDEVNPSLRVEIAKNGTVLGGDRPDRPARPRLQPLRHRVLERRPRPARPDTCGFAASPRFDFDQSSGHRALRAYVNHASESPPIQVFTFEQRSDGRELPTEAAFDVVAAC